ncbi:MAG TPA: hypothetical protein VGW35_03225 [Methylomirabilota bacterium]|jgi:hypothetical protein|nr:hypothetical protein [Methylomirabilota bacterium]
MKIQRLLVTLTIINFMLLVFLLAQMRPVAANTESSVLRGRGLEIVDQRGKVRASIAVQPANDTYRMPDGTIGYPETVILRLIDPNGRPGVKLQASVQGAGIGLGGESDPTYARLGAKGAESSLHLRNKDGREQVIKP